MIGMFRIANRLEEIIEAWNTSTNVRGGPLSQSAVQSG
jgi:hypothetical protein